MATSCDDVSAFIARCVSRIGTNGSLNRIGIPHEQSSGGPLFRKVSERYLADTLRYPKTPEQHIPVMVALTFDQFRRLETELGRDLCNSGDILFATMLVGAFDHNEPLPDDREMVDYRDIAVEATTVGEKIVERLKNFTEGLEEKK